MTDLVAALTDTRLISIQLHHDSSICDDLFQQSTNEENFLRSYRTLFMDTM